MQIAQTTTKKKAKRIEVRSQREVKKAMDLAAREQHQAIVISCHPADATWCAGGFKAACDKNGGGLSSNPDGGIDCSMDD